MSSLQDSLDRVIDERQEELKQQKDRALEPGSMSSLDGLIDQMAREKPSTFKPKIQDAVTRNPDQEAKVEELRWRTGLPSDVIRQDPDGIYRKALEADWDKQRLLQNAPELVELIENSEVAPVIIDDVAHLQGYSWMFKAGWRALQQGVAQVEYSALTGMQMERENSLALELRRLGIDAPASDADWAEMLGDKWQGTEKEIEELERQMSVVLAPRRGEPGGEGFSGVLARGYTEFLKQVPNIGGAMLSAAGTAAALGQLGPQVATPEEVVTVPLASIGAGLGAFTWTAAMERGPAYREISRMKTIDGERMDPHLAYTAASIAGGINGGLEVIGLSQWAKLFPGGLPRKMVERITINRVKEHLARKTFRRALRGYVKDWGTAAVTEALTEIGQEASVIAAATAAAGFSKGEFEGISREEAVSRMADIGLTTLEMMLVSGGLLSSPKLISDRAAAKRAEAGMSWLERLVEMSKDSKTLQRAPAVWRRFIRSNAANGPVQNVYVTVKGWDRVFGDGAEQAAFEVLGEEGRTQYRQAKELPGEGGDLVIPVERFVETAAAADLLPTLRNDIRLYQGQETLGELAVESEKQQEEMREFVQRDIEEFSEDERTVYDSMHAQLVGAGQDAKVADAAARFFTYALSTAAGKVSVIENGTSRNLTATEYLERTGYQISVHDDRVLLVPPRQQVASAAQTAETGIDTGGSVGPGPSGVTTPAALSDEGPIYRADVDAGEYTRLDKHYESEQEMSDAARERWERLPVGALLEDVDGTTWQKTSESSVKRVVINPNTGEVEAVHGIRVQRVSKDEAGNRVRTWDPKMDAINVLLRTRVITTPTGTTPAALSDRQSSIIDEMVSSGTIEDHLKGLYSDDPADALATDFDLDTVTDEDIQAIRAHFYQRTQDLLADGPETLTVYRADDKHGERSGAVVVTTDKKTASRFRGEVREFKIPRTAVVGAQNLAKGTYDEGVLLVPAEALYGTTRGQEPLVQPETLVSEFTTDAGRFQDQDRSPLVTQQWAILTAENPNAQQASEEQNRQANARLLADIERMGYVAVPVVGHYGGNPENSFMVPGMSNEDAHELGKKYGQESVLTPLGLIYSADGSVNPTKGYSFDQGAEDFFSEIEIDGQTVKFSADIDFNSETQIEPSSEVTIYHRSRVGGLSEIDPAKQGTGLGGREFSTRQKNAEPGTFVERSNFGIPGRYYEERVSALPNVYVGRVDRGELYDFREDPDGLIPDLAQKGYRGDDLFTQLEKAVKEGGQYRGLIDSQTGHVILFFKQPVRQLASPEDIARRTRYQERLQANARVYSHISEDVLAVRTESETVNEAVEAAYHLMGGAANGWTIMRAGERLFLEHATGQTLFHAGLDLEDMQPSSHGLPAANPSPRVRGIITRVIQRQNERARRLYQELAATDPRLEDTAVVGKDGKPLMVFHGTRSERGFPYFKGWRAGGRLRAFFAEDPTIADGFAGSRSLTRIDEGARVIPAFLSVRKPFLFDSEDGARVIDAWVQRASDKDLLFMDPLRWSAEAKAGSWRVLENTRFVDHIRSLGYDGMKLSEKGSPTWAVFSNDQIIPAYAPDSKGRRLYQTVSLRTGTESTRRLGLPTDRKPLTREVAAALEERQVRKYGVIEFDDYSLDAEQRIARWMAAEVRHELQPENAETSGAGWYSEKFQRALDTLGEVFPELVGKPAEGDLPGLTRIGGTQKNARDFLTLLIAITSDGQKVSANWRGAIEMYRAFRETGKLDATTGFGGERVASIRQSIDAIETLFDEIGSFDEIVTYLLEEVTVGDMKRAYKERTGKTLRSDYKVNARIPRAGVIFGAKLGPFFANLMGLHGYLTMDRWWTRTFNRYRGKILTEPTKKGLARFRELIGEPGLSDEETIYRTIPYEESYRKKDFKDGTEIEKAANTIHKAAFGSLRDSPKNGSDREFMIRVVNRVQKNLARSGYNLTVADIQAILWYYEKRLYGELGARFSQDVSYEEVARSVVEQQRGETSDQPVGSAAQDGRVHELEGPDGAAFELTEAVPDERTQAAEELEALEGARRLYQDSLSDPTLDPRLEGTAVVDEDGAPLMVFHGTSQVSELNPETDAGFESFDPDTDTDDLGFIWFTDTPSEADRFSAGEHYGVPTWMSGRGWARGRRTIPAFLSVTNPVVVDLGGRPWGFSLDRFNEALLEAIGVTGEAAEDRVAAGEPATMDELLEAGYDGIIIRNVQNFRESGRVPPDRITDEDLRDEILALQEERQRLSDSDKFQPEKEDTVDEKLRRLNKRAQSADAANPVSTSYIVFSDDQIIPAYAPNYEGRRLYQPGYHGSPYEFDSFSLERIGTGEGSQAFGWGLYFAESIGTAMFYQRALSDRSEARGARIDSATSTFANDDEVVEIVNRALTAASLGFASGDVDQILSTATEMLTEARDVAPPRRREAIVRALDFIDEHVDPMDIEILGGHLYKVELPEDSELAVWDSPLEEQPEAVRRILEQLPGYAAMVEQAKTLKRGQRTFERVYKHYANRLVSESRRPDMMMEGRGDIVAFAAEHGIELGPEVSNLNGDGDKAMSLLLAALGLPGHRFLDGQSRKRGGGTFNYVIYDDSRVTITERNGEPVSQEVKDRILEQKREEEGRGPRTDYTEQLDEAGGPSSVYQGEGGKANGYINILANGKRFEIHFLTGNRTTAFHEMAHFFLYLLHDLSIDPDADPQVARDFKVILRALGVKSMQELTAKQDEASKAGKAKDGPEERWARMWEAYLMRGEAPSAALQDVFMAARAWMLLTYKKAETLGVKVSDEVKDVFDRMLATDQEIDAVRQQQHMQVIQALKDALTDAEWREYQRMVTQAGDDQREELQTRMMQTLARESTEWFKGAREQVREEILAELSQIPLYRALSWLTRGQMPDGSEAPDELFETVERTNPETGEAETERRPLKLSKEIIVERYGEEVAASLPRSPYVYSVSGGLDPDAAALIFGYDNGAELLRDLASTKGKRFRQMAAEETKRRMSERFGDLLEQRSEAVQAAMDAVHNDAQMAVLLTELRMMRRIMERDDTKPDSKDRKEAGPPVVRDTDLMDKAREYVRSRRVGELRPHVYLQKERKHATAAFKAAESGNVAKAYQEKQQQAWYHALYRATRDAREETERAARYLQKMSKTSALSKLGLAGRDYLEAVTSWLEQFRFRKESSNRVERAARLRAFLEKAQEDGGDPVIPKGLASATIRDAETQHYSELTVERLLEVRDAVKNVQHLARLKNTFQTRRGRMERGQILNKLLAQLEKAYPVKRKGRVPVGSESRKDRATRALQGIDAELVKIEQLIIDIDGGFEGPWHDYVWNVIADAQAAENDMQVEYTKKIVDAIHKLRKRTKIDLRREVFTEAGTKWNLEEVLAIALNYGNESNWKKLLKGGQQGALDWDEDTLEKLFANLSEAEWDFVQEVWDLLESLYPEIEAMERRLTGLPPGRVQRRAFTRTFKDGTTKHYAGGYYPVMYDPEQSSVGEKQVEASDTTFTLFGQGYSRAATSNSHIKDRNEQFARPFNLTLEVIPRHLTQVIHDLTHREAVISVYRILSEDAMIAAMNRHLGPAYREEFKEWIRWVANEWAGTGRMSRWERGNRRFRANASMMALGFKTITATQNFANFSNVLEEVGVKWLIDALFDYTRNGLGGGEEMTAFIHEKSAEMRHRFNNLDRDLRDELKKLTDSPGVLSQVKEVGLRGMMMTDAMVAYPAWLAAYRQFLHEHRHDEPSTLDERAVDFANSVVRMTLTAAGAKDLAGVQRQKGEFMKSLTVFYSWFSGAYSRYHNLVAEGGRERRNGRMLAALPRLFVRAFWFWAVPALMSELLSARTPGSDGEDEGWIRWALKTLFVYPFMTIPGIRDALSALNFGSVRPTPMGALTQTAVRAGNEVWGVALGGEEIDQTTWKLALQAGGYATGAPTGQLALSLDYIWDVVDGDAKPATPWEFLQGNLTYIPPDARGGGRKKKKAAAKKKKKKE